MNISYIVLAFLAWQLLGKKDGGGAKGSPNLSSLSNFLNDNTKDLLDTVSKFGSKESSGEDKMSAIFQMMTNPTVAEFTSNLFSGGANKQQQPQSEQRQNEQKYSNEQKFDRNDEGYVFKDTPSNDARDFFKPIENIAGSEASHKLYHIYDNWYSKKTK